MNLLAIAVLAGCGGGQTVAEASLLLDGPELVRVDRLGPVAAPPRAVLSDGGVPEGLQWSVDPPEVARIDGDRVVAEAPGRARITGTWNGQSVDWTLAVEPAMTLRIDGAPARLSVGDTLSLRAVGLIGEEAVDPGAVTWSSSDEELLPVDPDGSATALGPGRVWVTADSPSGAQAVVEIDIR